MIPDPLHVTAPQELERLYRRRFGEHVALRARVWNILTARVFQQWIRPTDAVLDLGCGYGEFINQIACARKYAMDLNPASAGRLDESVRFLQQDCSAPWAVPAGSLDVVFSSNFLEHLPSKAHVDLTLDRARAALRPGGRLILMGPNIRFLAGEYWDFWDHHVPISHESIVEALRIREFEIERVWSRFLPYTMVGRGRTAFSPVLTDAALRIYLACPFLWRAFGRQFLVVARA